MYDIIIWVRQVIRFILEHNLLQLSERELEQFSRQAFSPRQLQDSGIYTKSLHLHNGSLYLLARSMGSKFLYVVSKSRLPQDFSGILSFQDDIQILKAPCTWHNYETLTLRFPFLRPVRVGKNTPSLGCVDYFEGESTPGFVRAVTKFNITPVFEQPASAGPLANNFSTPKDDPFSVSRPDISFYPEVVVSTGFSLFQEGYNKLFGISAGCIKSFAQLKEAMSRGVTFFSLDVSQLVLTEGEKVMSSENRFQGAIDFIVAGNSLLKKNIGTGKYDLELNLGCCNVSPMEHAFLAEELDKYNIDITSITLFLPGMEMKNCDFQGDYKKFIHLLESHCNIAQKLGDHKINLINPSDKFTIYPLLGKLTKMKFHLRFSGISWLEMLRTIAKSEPSLFMKILNKAFLFYPEIVVSNPNAPDIAAINSDPADNGFDTFIKQDAVRELFSLARRQINSRHDLRKEIGKIAVHEEELFYLYLELVLDNYLRKIGVSRI